jgi:hypothetical protein
VVGELVEHRKIVLAADEKLVAQLTSRRKLYDSKGREKLESKAEMRARGLESPDRADAVIGAAVMALPGFTGGITMDTLVGVHFGRPQGGRALFDFEPVTFD